MDLRNLELFLHLADSLHFGKSADAMAVRVLLVRVWVSVVPTAAPAGTALAAH